MNYSIIRNASVTYKENIYNEFLFADRKLLSFRNTNMCLYKTWIRSRKIFFKIHTLWWISTIGFLLSIFQQIKRFLPVIHRKRFTHSVSSYCNKTSAYSWQWNGQHLGNKSTSLVLDILKVCLYKIPVFEYNSFWQGFI